MEKASEITIPKITHFIWAGGEKLMALNEIDTAIKWALKNNDWEIWLWVDKKTYSGNIEEEYKKLFNERLKELLRKLQELQQRKELEQKLQKEQGLEMQMLKSSNTLLEKINEYQGIFLFNEPLETVIEKLQKLVPKSTSAASAATVGEEKFNLNLKIKDITEENVVDDYVRYEIDRFNPNYGASSDMLRYKILYRNGGAYFDLDVMPGKHKLTFALPEDNKHHILFIDAFSQEIQLTAEAKENAAVASPGIGNDIFICTKSNPWMEEFLKKAQSAYEFHGDGNDILLYRIMRAHGGKNIRNNTILFTGPMVIKEIVGLNKPEDTHGKIFFTRDAKNDIVQPLKNTTHWLEQKVRKIDRKTCLKIITDTIEFEAKHFHVLRLDDHIADLIVCSEDKDKSVIKCLTEIVDIANNLEVNMDIPHFFIQLTGEYRESIERFELIKEAHPSCCSIFSLTENTLLYQAIILQTNYDVIFTLEKLIKNSLEAAEELNDDIIQQVFSSRDQKFKDKYKEIIEKILFSLTNLSQQINLFNNSEIEGIFNSMLKKAKCFCKALGGKYSNQEEYPNEKKIIHIAITCKHISEV